MFAQVYWTCLYVRQYAGLVAGVSNDNVPLTGNLDDLGWRRWPWRYMSLLRTTVKASQTTSFVRLRDPDDMERTANGVTRPLLTGVSSTASTKQANVVSVVYEIVEQN